MLNVLWIAVICTLITDVLDFWGSFSPYLTKWISGGKFHQAIDFKLFTCSTCQTWWLGLIYLLVMGLISLQNIAITLAIATMTPIISSVWHVIFNTLQKILTKIGQ